MPSPQGILEQLRVRNDQYHEIINDIMENTDTFVGVKVGIGAVAKGIFESMDRVYGMFRHSVED